MCAPGLGGIAAPAGSLEPVLQDAGLAVVCVGDFPDSIYHTVAPSRAVPVWDHLAALWNSYSAQPILNRLAICNVLYGRTGPRAAIASRFRFDGHSGSSLWHSSVFPLRSISRSKPIYFHLFAKFDSATQYVGTRHLQRCLPLQCCFRGIRISLDRQGLLEESGELRRNSERGRNNPERHSLRTPGGVPGWRLSALPTAHASTLATDNNFRGRADSANGLVLFLPTRRAAS